MREKGGRSYRSGSSAAVKQEGFISGADNSSSLHTQSILADGNVITLSAIGLFFFVFSTRSHEDVQWEGEVGGACFHPSRSHSFSTGWNQLVNWWSWQLCGRNCCIKVPFVTSQKKSPTTGGCKHQAKYEDTSQWTRTKSDLKRQQEIFFLNLRVKGRPEPVVSNPLLHQHQHWENIKRVFHPCRL